jgi:hypothetical protein
VDKGSDVELASDIRNELEKVISWFLKVMLPKLIRSDPRPNFNVAFN